MTSTRTTISTCNREPREEHWTFPKVFYRCLSFFLLLILDLPFIFQQLIDFLKDRFTLIAYHKIKYLPQKYHSRNDTLNPKP